jgi:L,D-transpeptidase catalytic domain
VTRRRLVLGVALLGAGAVLLVVLLRHQGSSARAAKPQSFLRQAGQLPAPQQPAFKVGRPRLLDRHERIARFAPVRRPTDARREPGGTAASIGSLDLHTPEGTSNVVLVLGERRERDGLWVHIRLAVLPNNLTGWVPRRALGGYHFLHTYLIVDREHFTATLFRERRRVFSAPIGVGKPDSPTPAGQFYIRDRLSGFGDPFYGPVAFGTSARSAVLTDWPAGGFIGLHGTNEPDLIPGRISHGCIRMRNPDIVRLSRLMPVGTPITIR